MAKKMLEREVSGVKSRIWSDEEDEKVRGREVKVVSVIYYIARNGQLKHPHLMEVPLSSSQRMLCLKDVINRLNSLRGHGMAHSYSWSAKRSYKKGYVWQDLSENDFIYPCNGHGDEYILKGTQLFHVSSSSSSRSNEAAVTIISPPSSTDCSSETTTSTTDSDSPAEGSTKKTMKTKTKEPWNLGTINASTQTENQEKEHQSDEEEVVEEIISNNGDLATSALPVSGNIIKEPSSSSSSSNMREHCRIENENQSGRMKASTVLMQLMRCVSSKKLHNSEYT